jgi:hypothetical protein
MRWDAFDLFVIRTTGFTYDRLAAMRTPSLVTTCRDLLRAREGVAALRSEFLERAQVAPRPSDRSGFRRARAVVESVKSGRLIAADDAEWASRLIGLHEWAPRWNPAIGRATHCKRAFESTWAAGVAAARAVIRRHAADDRIQEAIYLLTPEVYERTLRRVLEVERAPDAPPNQDERKIVSFLQRLCSKCDTNAFAGPIGYGSLDGLLEHLLPGPEQHERRGFVAHWALRDAVLAVTGGSNGWQSRRPKRGPAAALVDLSPTLSRAVEAADGTRSWRDIFAAIGAKLPAEALARLERSGIVWSGPALPTSEPDALAALERSVDRGLNPELATLTETLRSAATRYASGSIEQKAAALADAEKALRRAGVEHVRRGAGLFYSDRTVLYEEDLDGSLQMRLSPSARSAVVRELSLALDFAAAAADYAVGVVRDRVQEQLCVRFPGETAIPFPRFLRNVELNYPVDLSDAPVAEDLVNELRASWDGEEREVALDGSRLREILPPSGRGRHAIYLASPDVFLAAESLHEVQAGNFDVVLGEVHWGLQLFSNLCCFISDRDALVGSARAWIERDPERPSPINVALGDRFGKMAFLEIFPRTLELSGPSTGSGDVLRPEDLVVSSDGDLMTRAGEVVQLMLGDPEGKLHAAFALPALRFPQLRIGRHTPRVRVGRAIWQRESWWFSGEDLARLAARRPIERLEAVVDLFDRHRIPERVFVKFAEEPKPIHIDLANPHLVDLLVHGARGGEVRVMEMLPEPEHFWLRGSDGTRPCELRLALVG